MRITTILFCVFVLAPNAFAAERSYAFDGRISREVLENYLSRSITMMDLASGAGDPDDNFRMLKSIGAKFAGRSIYLWGGESRLKTPAFLEKGGAIAKRIHAMDPEMIIQAGVYEIVTTQVAEIPIPARVFETFDLPPEARNFRYEGMLYDEGKLHDHWHRGASVPDMSKRETRLWFYFLSTAYIDIGAEAIHCGQVELIGRADPGYRHWWDLLSRVRLYAKAHARRHLVILDAHVPSGGIAVDGKLLFDFHSFPLRPKEIPDSPEQAELAVGFLDSIYGRSKGGVSPSGWSCTHLPYLVEIDNFGSSGRGGQRIGGCWVWGYDEICWFARQEPAYRDKWLRYAWAWVREHDPNGFLEMPGSRCLADKAAGKSWYFANRRSEACPGGFGDEETIRAIWAGTSGKPAAGN